MRLVLLAAMAAGIGAAQRNSGELRLSVVDPSGSPLEARARLTSQATDVDRLFATSQAGRYTARVLPFGRFRLELRQGFATSQSLVDVHSENPLELTIALGVAPVETALVVRESDTLLDPGRTGFIQHIGRDTIRNRRASIPGRAVLELVNTQPGWLLEANGILHPRGSEYQVQYVIDGIPILDNRSPAFAQVMDIEEFESMHVRTGNYPAEYGRKLGGVIELTTERDSRAGLHGKAVLGGGSFATRTGYASTQYSKGRSTAGVSVEAAMTDRYLDPPVERNYTNHGSGGGVSARFVRDSADGDRTRIYVHRRRTGFLVPNELLQHSAGQRQDRAAAETMGHISHQRVFSPRLLGSFRLMARDSAAELWSNSRSTPILPWQDRGFREMYLGGAISAGFRNHEFKAGAEAIFGSHREEFAYRITAYRLDPGGVQVFDPELPPGFRFHDRRRSNEQSVFVQDSWHAGGLTLSAGLRFDRYRLALRESGWSPRLGVAYHIPQARLVLRASYDRTFETPAVENLLLAGSNQLRNLEDGGVMLPLKPARGHYYEAGFSTTFGSRLRLDGAGFRRRIRNYPDDSLLLNTGVTFPIAFSRADIQGYEARLEMPVWRGVSGSLGYAYLLGRGFGPVSGGVFLGDDAGEALAAQGSFPITQDQRNTARARVRWQYHRRAWLALGARYNSGLPVEIEGLSDDAFMRAQYGERVLDRVNFARGRVRPSTSVDVSSGVELWKGDRGALRIAGDVLNVAGRLNLINFSGVFSGTALEPGRSVHLRLQSDF